MGQALQVTTIQGVRGYLDENGTAWLNAEDVARGLGFVQVHKERVTTDGYNYSAVRWGRVNGYLKEFGFCTQVCKDDFIPENMFYRLAMKASNAAAQAFQAKVADEILPAIRKHGVYMTVEAAEKILFNPDFIIGLAQQVKDANAKIAELQPKADYCVKVLESKEHLTSELIAKEYGKAAAWLHETLIKLGAMYMRRRGKKYYYYMKSPYDKEEYRDSETTVVRQGMTVVSYYWTQKGRNFIYNFLKKHGIFPLTEREGIMPALL